MFSLVSFGILPKDVHLSSISFGKTPKDTVVCGRGAGSELPEGGAAGDLDDVDLCTGFGLV